MYIRTKTRLNASGKKYTYAYITTTKYRKTKTPKQKVKQYLGRVFVFPKVQEKEVYPLEEIAKKSLKEALKDLICRELQSYGFNKEGEKWVKEEIIIDFYEPSIKNKISGKNVCIKLNEGILSTYALKQLLFYILPRAREKEIAKDFAKKCVEAGLTLEKSLFIELFNQIKLMIINSNR